MATALDKRPPSAESQYDPETVRLMKELGVWHPALALSPGSERRPNPEYTREQQTMAQIAQMRAHQDQLKEAQTSREASTKLASQTRSDALAEAERGRNERAGALRELKTTQESDRRNQGLVQALGQAVPGSPEHKAIMNQYLKAIGVGLPPTPVDPKAAALQAFKDKKAGVAPGTPTATAKTSMSPSALAAPETPGTRHPFIGGDVGSGQWGNVAADFVAGGKYSTAPAGSDKSLDQGFVDKLPFRTPLAQGDVNYQEKPPQATASTSFSPSALTAGVAPATPQTLGSSLAFKTGQGAREVVGGLNPATQVAPLVPVFHDFVRGLLNNQATPAPNQQEEERKRLATVAR